MEVPFIFIFIISDKFNWCGQRYNLPNMHKDENVCKVTEIQQEILVIQFPKRKDKKISSKLQQQCLNTSGNAIYQISKFPNFNYESKEYCSA